jgi:hypothetical protein
MHPGSLRRWPGVNSPRLMDFAVKAPIGAASSFIRNSGSRFTLAAVTLGAWHKQSKR